MPRVSDIQIFKSEHRKSMNNPGECEWVNQEQGGEGEGGGVRHGEGAGADWGLWQYLLQSTKIKFISFQVSSQQSQWTVQLTTD